MRATIGEPLFIERGDRVFERKLSIGRVPARLVLDGERSIIDVGTTALQVACYFAGRRGLTVATTAVPVADALPRGGYLDGAIG